jgi:hypothetical protein
MFIVAGIDRGTPIRASIAAIRIAGSFSADAALPARKASNRKPLTIDDRRDDLLSPQRKFRGTLRRLFHQR